MQYLAVHLQSICSTAAPGRRCGELCAVCAAAVRAQSLPQEAEELVDELPTEQGAQRFPAAEVVRTKSFFLPPMSLEEALEQARAVGQCLTWHSSCVLMAAIPRI